jgi:hypothetical protein
MPDSGSPPPGISRMSPKWLCPWLCPRPHARMLDSPRIQQFPHSCRKYCRTARIWHMECVKPITITCVITGLQKDKIDKRGYFFAAEGWGTVPGTFSPQDPVNFKFVYKLEFLHIDTVNTGIKRWVGLFTTRCRPGTLGNDCSNC